VKRYHDTSVPDEVYEPSWCDAYAERLRDGTWFVEINDGDAMGGSSNTTIRLGSDRFHERFVPAESYVPKLPVPKEPVVRRAYGLVWKDGVPQ
jgi:hypothetical protein